jgi:hypothetical protein
LKGEFTMNKRRYLSATSISLMFSLCFVAAIKAQTNKDSENNLIRFWHNPQTARGTITEVVVGVDPKATVQSAEVIPSEGVSIAEIKALEQTDGDRSSQRRRWALKFSVTKEAQPGKRSVVLITSSGRSAPQPFEIPPHVPMLSDFTILPSESSPARLVFTISVFDEEADLGEVRRIRGSFTCGERFIFVATSPDKVVQKDPKNTLVYVTLDVSGAGVKGNVCELELTLTDKNDYEGRLKTTVELK